MNRIIVLISAFLLFACNEANQQLSENTDTQITDDTNASQTSDISDLREMFSPNETDNTTIHERVIFDSSQMNFNDASSPVSDFVPAEYDWLTSSDLSSNFQQPVITEDSIVLAAAGTGSEGEQKTVSGFSVHFPELAANERLLVEMDYSFAIDESALSNGDFYILINDGFMNGALNEIKSFKEIITAGDTLSIGLTNDVYGSEFNQEDFFTIHSLKISVVNYNYYVTNELINSFYVIYEDESRHNEPKYMIKPKLGGKALLYSLFDLDLPPVELTMEIFSDRRVIEAKGDNVNLTIYEDYSLYGDVFDVEVIQGGSAGGFYDENNSVKSIYKNLVIENNTAIQDDEYFLVDVNKTDDYLVLDGQYIDLEKLQMSYDKFVYLFEKDNRHYALFNGQVEGGFDLNLIQLSGSLSSHWWLDSYFSYLFESPHSSAYIEQAGWLENGSPIVASENNQRYSLDVFQAGIFDFSVYAINFTDYYGNGVNPFKLDTQLSIFNENNELLQFDENGQWESTDSILLVDLQPGSYELVVSSAREGDSGEFNLIVTCPGYCENAISWTKLD